MPSELGKKMLSVAAKFSHIGADREVFFSRIRGIRYADLEKELSSLERDGFITIEWVGPSNFTVFLTGKGAELMGVSQGAGPAPAPVPTEPAVQAGSAVQGEQAVRDEEDTQAPAETAPVASEEVSAPENEPENEEEEVSRMLEEIIGPDEEESGETAAAEAEEPPEKGKKAPPPPPEVESQVEEENAESAAIPPSIKSVSSTMYKPTLEETPPSVEEEPDTDLTEGLNTEAAFENEAASQSMRCIWENQNECPILKSREMGFDVELVPEHCIACQLVEIKHLLRK